MTAAKKSAAKKPRVRKSRAKPKAPKDTAPVEAAAIGSAAAPADLADASVIEEKWEAPCKVAKNADAHTRITKRQQALVMVILSQAASNLQDLPDDGGELEQIGVTWVSGAGTGKMVPYPEIVQAFVDQAPHLAESIKVTDER